jgi:hypothetical protein
MMSIGIYAVTRIVDINGAGQYTSIQTAINASSPGDSVLVYPGIYLENIFIQTNNLTIVSQEYFTNNPAYIDSTVIDGRQLSFCIRIYSNTQGIVVRGFSITNGKSTGGGGGVSLSTNSSSSIVNCNIYGNKARLGGGVIVLQCSTSLSGVNIYDNYAYNSGGGLYINSYMSTVNVTFDPINRCSIYNNTAGIGQDIVTYNISSDLSIPLDMFTVSNPTSYYALPSRSSGSNEYQLLFDIQREHHQEINSDLYVSPEGEDTNDGLSPATALKTIKTAIYRIASDSLNPKTVHILQGIYSRIANQQLFPIPLKQFVNVVGAGIDETQIIGEQDPAFPSVLYYPLCVFSLGSQNKICLENLSISTANSANSLAISGSREDGTILRNLRLHNLSPQDNAVISLGYSTNSLWENVIIEDIVTNSMGLVHNSGSFTGTIRNCVFRNATSTYISPDVWANPLIWMTLGQDFNLENTVFSNLTMQDDDSQAIVFGGELYQDYVPHYSVQNCIFSNINCNDRGTLLHDRNYPVVNITNCTFAGQNGNGEALMVNGIVTISNCIFYNNRSKEIAINPMDFSGITTTLTLNNNLIRNGFSDIWQAPGNTIHYNDTNITGNPLFLGGDDINNPLYYSLSAASPCINMGTVDTTGLNLLPYDLAGNWRIWDGRIDMGCYEYGSEPYVGIDDPTTPALQNGLLSAYPNPFTTFTNLKVILPANQDNILPRITTASIDIYNIKGQKVKSISLDPSKVSEQFTYWDGRDDVGRQCSSGIYFLNLSVNGKRCLSKKVTLFR